MRMPRQLRILTIKPDNPSSTLKLTCWYKSSNILISTCLASIHTCAVMYACPFTYIHARIDAQINKHNRNLRQLKLIWRHTLVILEGRCSGNLLQQSFQSCKKTTPSNPSQQFCYVATKHSNI